ncbi:uncharacterized protein LOC123431374 [Hordeum vulgare subsp. vulgare]|uniref:uncharacterized protein LOC123431374 n=1 Tax=Hordeum vulgare subsp. vulgare TaxID=112509 RepID=UPI001D1A4C81|nr:uncharacterized protein LOC123431374 [Hordeum vulgare subsp. vulgare]
MRSLKRPHESQQQSFTDVEVREGSMKKACSRFGAMASSQLRMPKSGNAAAAALNHFMLPPAAKLTSMLAPPNKNCDQDSLLLEVPRNARPPQAEFLRCCPPPSGLSTASSLTAASPPTYQSQLR